MPRYIENDAKDLIKQLLAKDPNERPDAYQILSHKYLANFTSNKNINCVN